jgi:hypothetical protein
VHSIVATLKVKDSESNYEDFIRFLCSIVPKTQWIRLKYEFYYFLCFFELMFSYFHSKDEALILWNERCAPRQVT